jgi:hypothetical protein
MKLGSPNTSNLIYQGKDASETLGSVSVLGQVSITESDPVFAAWVAIMFMAGEKITGVDSGTFGATSLTDDYRYSCVLTGTGETTTGAKDGTAIWKKDALAQSI